MTIQSILTNIKEEEFMLFIAENLPRNNAEQIIMRTTAIEYCLYELSLSRQCLSRILNNQFINQ